jgi:ABC-2 type transport system ATP-binding protein
MNVIDARGLVRYYSGVRGVAGLDLIVPQGSVMGLLGTNGSGKTTAIKLILGQLVPNQGSTTLWDEDPLDLTPELRSRIAYVADEVELPGWMKLQEGMELHASYYPQWDQSEADALITRFDLQLHRPFGTLSKGQKRRFFLVLALAQQPELIVLDEPTGGLDAIIRREFLDLLIELRNKREVTILLSSHILSDVERVIDRVAFVSEGRLLLQSELDTLKGRVKRLCVPVGTDVGPIAARFDVISQTKVADMTQIHVANFAPEKLEGLDVAVEHLNLEEIFLAYHRDVPVAEGLHR